MTQDFPAHWPRPLTTLCRVLAPSPGAGTPDLTDEEWHQFAELAVERHRVAPALSGKLGACRIPAEVERLLAHEVEASSWQALRQIGLSHKVLEPLAAHGIQPVILKGWPLGQQVFGAPGMRHSRDLDLLVHPDEVSRAAGVLNDLGFRPTPVYRLRGRLTGSRALLDECYDLEFQHAQDDSRIELHWRSAHYRGWPDFCGRAEMIETIDETPIGQIRVLSPTANLIYLSIHGGMHIWARLKWLLDIAWLAERRGAAGLEDDLALARSISAHRALALALRLSSRVFGTPMPPSIANPPGAVARLEKQALGVIADPRAAPGSLRYKLMSNAASLRLAENFGQLAGVARYGVWRRLRLGAAGLSQSVLGCPRERLA